LFKSNFNLVYRKLFQKQKKCSRQMRFKRISIFENAKTSNVSKIPLKKFQICLFLRWCSALIVGCQKNCYYCESYVTFFSFYFIH
jgi:hypothetical protein